MIPFTVVVAASVALSLSVGISFGFNVRLFIFCFMPTSLTSNPRTFLPSFSLKQHHELGTLATHTHFSPTVCGIEVTQTLF